MTAKRKPTRSADADVAWAKLATAKSKASKVPSHLRALREASTQNEACGALANLLAHRGEAFEATPHAFRAILSIALDESVAKRAEIVDLLVWLVTLGEPGERDLTGIALSDPAIAKKYGTNAAKALVDIAREAAPTLAPLLAHEDPLVRARAAHLIGLIPFDDAGAVAALDARFRIEESPAVRASIALALGYRAAESSLAAGVAKTAADLLRGETSPLPRGCLALARALAVGDVDRATKEDDLRDLFDAFGRSETDPAFRLSLAWNGGALDGLVIQRLATLSSAGKELAAHAVSAAMANDLGAAPWKGLRIHWPRWVLKEFFTERRLEEAPASKSDFSALQLELLRRLSLQPNEGLYEAFGLPFDIRSRRRVLGMDPPGIMERAIECPLADSRSLPIWRVFRLAFEKLKSVKPRPEGAVVLAAVDEAGLSALDTKDRLDAWMESTAKAYGANWGSSPMLELVTTVSPAERGAFVKRWVEKFRNEPCKDGLESSGWVIAWTALRDHPVLPAEIDDIVNFYGEGPYLGEVLEAIPLARREAIASREVERDLPIASRVTGFAELMPAAAAAYAQRAARKR